MKQQCDVLIVGSGLGGLVAANILARNGYDVLVLEKNNQIGGNLQVFVRDGKVFDSAVHYIGSLAKGQNLYRIFSYLGIMDALKLEQLDSNCYDKITFETGEREYCHAQGYERFREKLILKFPEEAHAIDAYIEWMQKTTDAFPLYNLKGFESYDPEIMQLTIGGVLDGITNNETLKAVLAGSNLLYAGDRDTPFYIHALSVNSYIQSAWRCVGGCGQIARLLRKRLEAFNGKIKTYSEVTGLEVKDQNIHAVHTQNGEIFYPKQVLSNIDPKQTLKLVKGGNFRKPYLNRINNLKDVISAFSVHIVLKKKVLRFENCNTYHFKDVSGVWLAKDYDKKSWPENYMLSMTRDADDTEWAETLTVLTYMRYEEVLPWEDTQNTVAQKNNRGATYERFKKLKTDRILTELEKKYPGIRTKIHSVYATTPLTYRDYIGNRKGAMYGYVKDSADPVRSIISPVTRIKNLFFTGQSLNMHGVVGVTISALLTCSRIIGEEKILDQIDSNG